MSALAHHDLPVHFASLDEYAMFDRALLRGEHLDDPHDVEPGNDTVNATVDKLCTDGFAAYVGTSLEQSQYTYTSLFPSADSWAAGDREVVCAVSNQDSSKMTGSVRGTAR